ncbi:MAG: DNA repair protein RecO [Alphaproteobacteria bacterium]
MEWTDTGVVLHAHRLGESKAVVTLLTAQHGVAKGVARLSKQAPLEIGTVVQAIWKARLETHLGQWTLEPSVVTCAAFLMDPGKLAGLTAACSWVYQTFPERNPCTDFYHHFRNFLEALSSSHWLEEYVYFELYLLQELGFGLDLSKCAKTGVSENLTYVSPKTGRSVSQSVGAYYHDRLLPLPPFIKDPTQHPGTEDIQAGLQLTGYFLEKYIRDHEGCQMPEGRKRLNSLLLRGKQEALAQAS